VGGYIGVLGVGERTQERVKDAPRVFGTAAVRGGGGGGGG